LPRTLHLLPDIVDPVDNRYLIVAVPDDDAYLRAVMGQLGQLAKWNNWQRDPLHLGRDAAERFHRAYLETLELLEELEYNVSPLTINVNCGSTCCPTLIQLDLDVSVHVGQDVIDDINALPGGQFDNGYLVPSPDYPDYPAYIDRKCAYANQLATDIHRSWENIATLALSAGAMSFPAFSAMLTSGALGSSLVGLLGGVITTATVATAIVGLLVSVGTIFGVGFYFYFEHLQSQMTIEELRCALYGAETAEDARTRVSDQFHAWGIQAGLLPIGDGLLIDIFVSIARAMTPLTILEPLFDWTPYVSELPVADCSLCPAVQPPPALGLAGGLLHLYTLDEGTGQRLDSVDVAQLDPFNSPGGTVGVVNGSNLFVAADSTYLFGADASLVLPETQDWMIGVWFLCSILPDANGLTGQKAILTSGFDTAQNTTFMLMLYRETTGETKLRYVIGGSSPSNYVVMVHDHLINQNQWYCVLLGHDGAGNDMTIRVNDGVIGIQDYGGGYASSPSSRLYVAKNRSLTNYWDGNVDNIAIWNRILSEQEQLDWYNDGNGVDLVPYL
jgi:hypothetical protein